MWTKKTDLQIKEDLEKEKMELNKNRLQKSINIGIWSFIIVFFIKIIISLTIGYDYSPNIPAPSEIIKISEIPEYFPEFLAEALYWAVILMVLRFILPRLFQNNSSSLMCDKCFTTKNYDSDVNCKCGGVFYPLNNFEWIEEKKDFILESMEWIDKYRILKNKGEQHQ